MNTDNKFLQIQSECWDSYTKKISLMDLDDITKAEKIELEFLLDILKNPKNKQILDLGCGTGKFGLQLARLSNYVVGIDISKNSVKIANKTAKHYGIKNFRGEVDEFRKQKYINEFDYILAINIIHHTNKAKEILKNANIALKKDGILVIFEINPLNPLYIPFLIRYGQLYSHLTKEYLRSNIYSLKKLIKSSDLKISRIIKWGLLPTRLYNYSPKFKPINEFLNKIPILNIFSAFHVVLCKKS